MADAKQPIGQELGRKISVKEFGWNKETILEALIKGDKTKDLFLMRVRGVVTDLKAYKSREKGDEGELLEGFGLRGQFIAQGRDVNGTVTDDLPGSVCYLPGYITDGIVAAMQSGDDVHVNVYMDIYARYDPKASATSYVFIGRNLLPQDTTALDKLDQIAQQANGGKPLALPGN